ncbi:hypothetical protein [Cellulomonas taurus]|jgi:hypothetical protein|uniref:hypothetical protein n=1 Tax=Cellulomonas taurus TaxID=2729175 RepID=UPI00145F4FD9|nr:hypothetical protein [Cellulomonas taurus]
MNLLPALAAIIPSVGVGIIFWVAIRALMNADRSERAALARMDAEERSVNQPTDDESRPAD